MVLAGWLFLHPGTVLAADAAAVAGELQTAFNSWMKKHRIKAGAIAVSYQGRPVLTGGKKRDARTPARVASLSKTITALCALEVLRQSGKSVELTLQEVIPQSLAAVRLADQRYRTISLAQLISHNSGIQSRYHQSQLGQLASFAQESKAWQLARVLAEPLASDPGSGYHYNNANYLVLGVAIEALSGESYERTCQRQLLSPLGISSAALDRNWRVMTAWGGWRISAADFLALIDHSFPDNTILGRAPESTIALSDVGRGASYGPGTLLRKTRQGYNFWHAGSWRWKGNQRNDRFGAYFAAYDNGYTVVVNYDHDAYDGQQAELDGLFYRITHPR